MDSNRGPSAYQPNTLPLVQTGSPYIISPSLLLPALWFLRTLSTMFYFLICENAPLLAWIELSSTNSGDWFHWPEHIGSLTIPTTSGRLNTSAKCYAISETCHFNFQIVRQKTSSQPTRAIPVILSCSMTMPRNTSAVWRNVSVAATATATVAASTSSPALWSAPRVSLSWRV